jgi:hypothetical protein
MYVDRSRISLLTFRGNWRLSQGKARQKWLATFKRQGQSKIGKIVVTQAGWSSD